MLDKELIARIEQSERDYLISRIRSISEREGNPEGVELRSFGGATACYIRTMPWPLFNSVVGLTHDDLDQLDALLAFYRERNRSFQIAINPSQAHGELLKQLARRSMYQASFHTVLYGRPLALAGNDSDRIRICEVLDEHDFHHYAGVHCLGAGMGIEHRHHFANNNRGLMNRPGWRLFLALYDDVPGAVAVMHSSNGIASLALAATVPDYRRRGLQTALLNHRLHEAYKEKCEWVAAQAGFGSSSQHNMERVGMRVAWTRAMWEPLQNRNS